MPDDPYILQFLEAIEANEPASELPDMPAASHDDRFKLAGIAGRNKWMTPTTFLGTGKAPGGEPVVLTDSGRAVLANARERQDDDVADDQRIAVEERLKRRTRFMNQLYDTVGDNTSRVVLGSDVGTALGWDEAGTRQVVRSLRDKELVAYRALGGRIAITKQGVEEVETARQAPGKPTENLASLLVSIETADHSPVNIVHAPGASSVRTGNQAVTSGEGSGGGWRKLVIALVIGVLGSLIAAALWAYVHDDNESPADGRAVTVFNRVTNGAADMREDEELRLFYAPELCTSSSCLVPGHGYRSGDKIDHVVCQIAGSRITNGYDADDSDNANPQLFESTLWYGVRTDTGRLAYFSEVWADPNGRGGLGLPDCSSSAVDAPGQ